MRSSKKIQNLWSLVFFILGLYAITVLFFVGNNIAKENHKVTEKILRDDSLARANDRRDSITTTKVAEAFMRGHHEGYTDGKLDGETEILLRISKSQERANAKTKNFIDSINAARAQEGQIPEEKNYPTPEKEPTVNIAYPTETSADSMDFDDMYVYEGKTEATQVSRTMFLGFETEGSLQVGVENKGFELECWNYAILGWSDIDRDDNCEISAAYGFNSKGNQLRITMKHKDMFSGIDLYAREYITINKDSKVNFRALFGAEKKFDKIPLYFFTELGSSAIKFEPEFRFGFYMDIQKEFWKIK